MLKDKYWAPTLQITVTRTHVILSLNSADVCTCFKWVVYTQPMKDICFHCVNQMRH